jgi:hypothetical protein
MLIVVKYAIAENAAHIRTNANQAYIVVISTRVHSDAYQKIKSCEYQWQCWQAQAPTLFKTLQKCI